jgi:low affinity Fe/Cu permease
MNELFHKFAARISAATGSAWGFVLALSLVVIWALLGPALGYSEKWQLIINTTTTIMTFLMVFLIQNTQNRDARATHLKLDELLKSVKGARDMFVDIEEMSDVELEKLQDEFHKMHEHYAKVLERRKEKGG